MQAINEGAPLPPQMAERWWKVYGPVGYTPLRVVFLAHTFTGVWTHWVQGAVVPCTETPGCPNCGQPTGNRFTGYIASFSLTHKEEIVCALTEAACNDLRPKLEAGESLRGLTVELYRRRPPENRKMKANARVYVRYLERMPLEKCPAEFPIQHSLNRLWGINAKFVERGGKRLPSSSAQRLSGLSLPSPFAS